MPLFPRRSDLSRPPPAPAPSGAQRLCSPVPSCSLLSASAPPCVTCRMGCFNSKHRHFMPMQTLQTTQHSVTTESDSTTASSLTVVYVTVSNKEGKKLSQGIISEKLAACVNIVSGTESYCSWEGKMQTKAEELLIIKTRESLVDALTKHVKENHEHDVPEVIALPITSGNPKYLEWIKSSTGET